MFFQGKELPVFKAALHNHSTVSDGLFKPEEIIRIYAEKNFDVFAFSDHRKTNDISRYDSCGMTLISGIELHPAGPHGTTWHLLALNVPVDFPGEFATAQEAVNAVNNAGGIIFCAHPEWCGITAEDVAAIDGFAGLEVYNTSCRYNAKESSESVWNELTDRGIIYPALAVDDTHSSAEFFGGWTMIAAEDKSPESIMRAIAQGSFYATQGPEFTRLNYENGVFEAEFSEVEEVVLVGIRSLGDCIASPNFPEYGNTPLISDFKLDIANHRYLKNAPFRCRIRDSRGRYAWTPIFR